MIKPTVGRSILFKLAEGVVVAGLLVHIHEVREGGEANIVFGGWDEHGNPFGRKSVLLRQTGDEKEVEPGQAFWMPYQWEQAHASDPADVNTPPSPKELKEAKSSTSVIF